MFSDVLRVGRLGVDLFFALSGFILTHTYLRRLGPAVRVRGTVDFWWLRLARIYPVHIVMLFIAGGAVVAQAKVTGESLDRDWLNPIDFAKNLFLVQEWGPEPQRGWNFVAWSLSMEWLAYLVFPLLVLLLWFLHRTRGNPGARARLAGGAGSAGRLRPVDVRPVLHRQLGLDVPHPHRVHRRCHHLPDRVPVPARRPAVRARVASRGAHRIGAVRGAADPRGRSVRCSSARGLRLSRPPSGLDGDVEPLPPYYHLLLVPLLICWIGALALSRRGIARFLSTRALVLGGFISYSLYMTHLVWFGLWRAGMRAAGIDERPAVRAGLRGPRRSERSSSPG